MVQFCGFSFIKDTRNKSILAFATHFRPNVDNHTQIRYKHRYMRRNVSYIYGINELSTGFTYCAWYSSMVCTPLPEPPRVPLYTPNHLVFIGKVRLPQKRAVAKHPYRLRRITAWSCAASKLTGGRFSRTTLLGWILFRRVAARHRLFCSSLVDFEGCPCFINSRFRSVWCDAWWREWNLRTGPQFQPRSQSFTATHQFHVVVNWTELWWPEIENHVTVLVALNVAEAATRHCTKSSVEALFNCHSVWVLRWYWIWLYTCPSPLLPLHLPLTPNSLTGTLPQGPR